MKVAIVVLIAVIVTVASAVEPLGTCGGSCTSSATCASSSGDMLCRCVNFVCSMTDICGGSCVMDSQCSNWSGGNPNCVCSWTRCGLKTLVDAPDYNPFLDIAMTKMSKEKREEVQPIKDE